MDVQDPVPRDVENGLGNDLPVVGEHGEIGPEGADRVDGVGGADPRRLEDRMAALVAATATGAPWTFLPRPAGRSGAVTTATTSTPAMCSSR